MRDVLSNVMGSDVITPVGSMGQSVMFVLPDGQARLTGPPFEIVIEAPGPLRMLDMMLAGAQYDGICSASINPSDIPMFFR